MWNIALGYFSAEHKWCLFGRGKHESQWTRPGEPLMKRNTNCEYDGLICANAHCITRKIMLGQILHHDHVLLESVGICAYDYTFIW